MTGFEPWSSGVGSDRSNNCTTTTALFFVKQNRPSLKPTEVGGGGKLKHQEVQRYSFKEIFVSIFSPAEIFRLSQCDQIGQFLGYCVKHYFVSRNYCGSFLGIVWKFGLLFIPSSGHTGLSEVAIKGRQQERKKKSWNIFQVCDHQVKTGSDWMCPSTSHRPTTTKKCFSSFKKEKIPSKLFNFGPLSWPVWPA